MEVPDMFYELNDFELEEATITSLFMNPAMLVDVIPFLKPAHFSQKRFEWIYTAMTQLFNENVAVDIITMSDRIVLMDINPKKNRLLSSDLAQLLTNGFYGPDAAVEYAKMMVQKANLRGWNVLAGNIAKYVHKPEDPSIEKVNSHLLSLVFSMLREGEAAKAVRHISEIMLDIDHNIEQIQSGEEAQNYIPTGIKDLDEALGGGLFRKEMTTFAGRPSMGKTAIGKTIAVLLAQAGYKILIFSPESPDVSLGRRMLSQTSKINSIKLRTGDLDEDEWGRYTPGLKKASELPIWVLDRSFINAADIRAIATIHKMTYGLDMIMVDHLGELSSMITNPRYYNEVNDIGLTARSLRKTGRDLDVVMLCLQQLSRFESKGTLSKKNPPKPKLHHLRASGLLEEIFDVIGLLYRDEYYFPNTQYPNTLNINFAKQRDGSQNKGINLFFGKSTSTVSDLANYKLELNS